MWPHVLPCPKGCKNEIAHFMRKDLDKHLENDCPNRDHKCEHCGEKGTYAHITQVHDNTCEKKIVPCPNTSCTHPTTRIHLKECAYSEIPCEYQRLGCDVKILRKDMRAHEEDDRLHFHMALDKVIGMEEELRTMKNQISDAYKFKVTEYRDKKLHDKQFSSTFYSSRYGYHMKVTVYANGSKGDCYGTHISLYVYILRGIHDKELNWPFVGKVNIQMLNQLEDKNHHEKSMSITEEMNIMAEKGKGYRKFVPHSQLGHDLVKNTQYLKDDTLYFRVSVDTPDYKP